MEELPTLVEFLANLAGGAGVAAIVAFALEHIRGFQRLTGEAKKWVVLAMFLVLPTAAQVLLQTVPAEVWALAEPYWRSFAVGFVGWLGSQVAHAWDKRRRQT